MPHAFLTVAIAFSDVRANTVEAVLRRMNNPAAHDVRTKLDPIATVHFMSAIVVPDTGPGRCHLLLEISADGTKEQAAVDVARALDEELRDLLTAAGVPLAGQPLTDVLLHDNLRLGYGWLDTPGLPFSGVPGMSVHRILGEAELAVEIATKRSILEGPQPPMAKLRAIREQLWADQGKWKWAFAADPAPFLSRGGAKTRQRQVLAAGVAFARLLAPLLVVPLLLWPLLGLLPAILASVLMLAVLGAGAVFWLRRLEGEDRPDDSPPNAARLAEILLQENHGAQNLLATVSVMKPGLFRRLTLRLALGIVQEVSARTARPGFLGDIGVIHFARWVLIPGTDRLIFLSNFSNSWESYLEDFIVKAAEGLTSIWSNTAGLAVVHGSAVEVWKTFQ